MFSLEGSTNNFYRSDMQYIITQENGFANNTLLEIHQDKKGFLWIGTDIGLSRYDGINFHNYRIKGHGPQAIKRISEAELDDLLWLKLNNNKKIACFDKNRGDFFAIESTDSVLLNDVHDICMDDSVLYAITSNGISRLDYNIQKKSISITSTLLTDHRFPLKKLHNDKKYLYATDEENNILI